MSKATQPSKQVRIDSAIHRRLRLYSAIADADMKEIVDLAVKIYLDEKQGGSYA